jgi:hypothetical protein
MIFADGLSSDWASGYESMVELDPDTRAQVHEGDSSLAVQPGGFFNWGYVRDEPANPVGYTALRFAFHPGDVTGTSDRSSLQVELNTFSHRTVLLGGARAWVDLDHREWQIVEIPLEEFALAGDTIESIRFRGGPLEGTFYLDDIRLVTAAPQPGQPSSNTRPTPP